MVQGSLDGEQVPGADREPYDVPARATEEDSADTADTGVVVRTDPAFQRAVRNHSRTLESTGQFVFREFKHVFRGESDGDRLPTVRTVAADTRDDRYWSGRELEAANGVYDRGRRYQAGATVYERVDGGNGSVQYRPANETGLTPRETVTWAVRNLSEWTTQYPLERNGTTTEQGVEFTRYAAASVPAGIGCWPDGRPTPELRRTDTTQATALVDSQGVVRQFECVSGVLNTGNRYTERIVWTIDEVGTATVRPPAADSQSESELTATVTGRR